MSTQAPLAPKSGQFVRAHDVAEEVWHPRAMTPLARWYRLTLVSLVMAGTVGCDQATKQLAISQLRDEPAQTFLGGILRLTFAENPGAFLGLGGHLSRPLQFWLLTAGVGLLLLSMLFYVATSRRIRRLHVVAIALIAGGGVGNLIDRVMNDGRVVDFMNVGIGSLRTGIFNVADVAIMLGGGLLLLAARSSKTPGATQASLQ
jgi:signal peptidase II